MRKTIYPLLLITAILTGCQFTNREFADFTAGQNYQDGVFYVVSQRNSDLSQSLPADCYMPDGTPVSECGMQAPADNQPLTSSTSFTAFSQALLGWGSRNQLLELSGIYSSCRDYKENDKYDIMLSGKVILPEDLNFKRYILVSHYTIGSNAEAPSNCFSLEGIFAKLGYCVILPDYLGYGITADSIHPYLQMEATAYHVLSMYQAVKEYFDLQGVKPEHDDIILLGYSQGGATTMAVERLIETEFPEIRIRRVYAGGGPYDAKATYDRFVETNEASYPVAVPLVVQGMIAGNPAINVKLEDILHPRIFDHLDEWINSKKYSTAMINKAIGSYVTSDLLSEKGMDRTSPEVRELYKELSTNSIVNYSWEPQASVYMMHSMEDETVPFESNAIRAKSKWANANIQYNFGNYGSHVNTCLRFLYTVKPILENED